MEQQNSCHLIYKITFLCESCFLWDGVDMSPVFPSAKMTPVEAL